MRAFRSVLGSLFAVVGLFSFANVAMMWRLLPDRHANFYSWLAGLFLPVCGGLYVVAAVSYFLKWRSARFWCLAVSGMNLAVPFMMIFVARRFTHESVTSVLWSNALLLGLALAGGIAFWRWDPLEEKSILRVESAAMPGDGTWSLLNQALPVISLLVFSWLWFQWDAWGERVGLPAVSFWRGLMQAAIADLIVVVLHEAGHALCGLLLGSRVRAFFAGPLQFQVHDGRWRFRFNPAALLSMGGGAGVVPRRIDEPKSFQCAMIAAGPGVNAVTGLIAVWLVLAAADTAWKSEWFLLAMFATISLEAAIVNLIPLRTATGYSDGARILQLLRGSVWADYHEAFRIAAATTVSAVRPRDYDVAAIHRVMDAGIAKGLQGLFLRLFAYSCYVDRGQEEQAGRELAEAEAIYEEDAARIPAELLPVFVMDQAVEQRNPTRARMWWERMEEKKTTWFNGDYWMARSALCWIEGKDDEARLAWSKAHAYLSKMPQAGTYAFDNDVLARLETTIQTSATESVATAR
jgi:Peptidase family M50